MQLDSETIQQSNNRLLFLTYIHSTLVLKNNQVEVSELRTIPRRNQKAKLLMLNQCSILHETLSWLYKMNTGDS